jgi:DNA polymerase epsilon subunit 1
MAEYLPSACKKQFVKLVAEYVFEMHHFKEKSKEQENHGSEEGSKKTGKKSAEDLTAFMKQLLNSTIKRRLFSVVRQIQKQEVDEQDEPEEDEETGLDPYEFPMLPGSHLLLKNPGLEFIKLVSKFFSLDPHLTRETRLLRRDLLNLVGVREFSQDANFVNPCEAFSLPLVICDFCNHCVDLDLTREEDVYIPEEENQEIQKSWTCSVCHTCYDKVSIEQKLVNIVRQRLLTWQLQDLKCERCKLVRAEEIRETCADCSGKLGTELKQEEFLRRMKVFSNIAQYYELEMLSEVMDWVLLKI